MLNAYSTSVLTEQTLPCLHAVSSVRAEQLDLRHGQRMSLHSICNHVCHMTQVQEELKKAAAKSQDVEERQNRLQVDRQRLDIQLAKAKEGN